MTLHVGVDVATVWSSPDAPRAVDAPATADDPDLGAWTSALDAGARLGLHGRTETQLQRGEPVEVVEAGPTGWVRVVSAWQPSPKDARGYPGWVRSSHLDPTGGDHPWVLPPARIGADPVSVAEWALRFIGLQYLWGGLSPFGVDCSGLVHLAYREAGIVIPRDAAAQHVASRPVALGEEWPGDLYFFARDDGRVFHVGFVTGRGRMLHASESRGQVEEAPLAGERRATLAAAGRFLDPAH